MPELKVLQASHRTLPNQHRMLGTDVTVVLKADTGDGPCEYAAYIGVGDEEWVAEYGAKLTFQEALVHFSGLKRELYRTT